MDLVCTEIQLQFHGIWNCVICSTTTLFNVCHHYLHILMCQLSQRNTHIWSVDSTDGSHTTLTHNNGIQILGIEIIIQTMLLKCSWPSTIVLLAERKMLPMINRTLNQSTSSWRTVNIPFSPVLVSRPVPRTIQTLPESEPPNWPTQKHPYIPHTFDKTWQNGRLTGTAAAQQKHLAAAL